MYVCVVIMPICSIIKNKTNFYSIKKKNFKPTFEDIVQSKHGGHEPFSYTAAFHVLCK